MLHAHGATNNRAVATLGTNDKSKDWSPHLERQNPTKRANVKGETTAGEHS